jgi:hypothetical protein
VVSVFLDTFLVGSLAAILAHVLSHTGPALAVGLPPELMGWVFVVTAEVSVLGRLPFVFAVVRRQRQRWAVSLTHGSRIEPHGSGRLGAARSRTPVALASAAASVARLLVPASLSPQQRLGGERRPDRRQRLGC